jgi:hypothetical protein
VAADVFRLEQAGFYTLADGRLVIEQAEQSAVP